MYLHYLMHAMYTMTQLAYESVSTSDAESRKSVVCGNVSSTTVNVHRKLMPQDFLSAWEA